MKPIALAALTILVFLAPARAQERPRPPLPPGVKVLRDLEYVPGGGRAQSPESKLVGGNVQEIPGKAKAASPVTYVSAETPPFLIVHGDKDPLVPLAQSQELHAALQKAGVETTLHVVEGGGHGQGFDTPEIAQLVRDFFVRHLKK